MRVEAFFADGYRASMDDIAIARRVAKQTFTTIQEQGCPLWRSCSGRARNASCFRSTANR